MIDLDIVIVNWNSGPHLRDCLQSISPASQAAFLLSNCIVVDNASEDGSADGLDGLPLPLKVVKNQENKGFAYACNQGARLGNSGYILFLNPDVKLFPESLVKAIQFLDEKGNEQVGILGIQLVDEKGGVFRNTTRFPSPKDLFYQMIGFDRLWPRHFPPLFMTDWDHQESREVDQVTGAFYLVRRLLFDKLNGFDERFFMYFEDLDFAYRAKQAGWKSFYLAGARALHVGGGASYRVKAKRLFYVLRSRVKYVAKHYGTSSANKILWASLLVEFWVRLGRSVASLSKGGFSETIQAYRIYLRYLPQLRKDLGA
jgi:N-acetylglucosaminyl-diphospho-decaprenol L-rhamnosyltransferase